MYAMDTWGVLFSRLPISLPRGIPLTRPPWPEYGLLLAEAAASRSEDPWHRVGAVVLRPDHSVAGVGYNGAPAGIEIDWADKEERLPLVIHAEINALRWATPDEVRGGLLISTRQPCPQCLTSIAAYQLATVFFRDRADDTTALAQRLGLAMHAI